MTRYLLENGADVNGQFVDVDGEIWTALSLAVPNAFVDQVEILLAYGANVTAEQLQGEQPQEGESKS